MDNKYITVKEVALKNNCPECYNNEGLRLTFKQRFLETKLYKSITNDIKYTIDCKKCDTSIYPVDWNDDIERVFEYQKKAFTPKKTSTQLKKTSWIIIVLIISIIIGGIGFLSYTKL